MYILGGTGRPSWLVKQVPPAVGKGIVSYYKNYIHYELRVNVLYGVSTRQSSLTSSMGEDDVTVWCTYVLALSLVKHPHRLLCGRPKADTVILTKHVIILSECI